MQALDERRPEQDGAVTVCLKVDADVKALGSCMQMLDACGRDYSLQLQLLSDES